MNFEHVGTLIQPCLFLRIWLRLGRWKAQVSEGGRR
jgi:hypothetical protein